MTNSIYQEFRKTRPSIHRDALRIVNFIAENMENKDHIPEKPPEAHGFNERTWFFCCKNAWKLRSVKRKMGLPYAIHPVRMALALTKILHSRDPDQDAQAHALIHDYLEEGDGCNPEGFETFKKEFKPYKDICITGVLLSEPIINYEMYDAPKKICEYIAYTAQILLKQDDLNSSQFNALISDKIDNAHDWDYIVKNKEYGRGERDKRIIRKITYNQFIVDKLSHLAHPDLQEILKESIHFYKSYFDVSTLRIDAKLQLFEKNFKKFFPFMKPQIIEYHNRMGI